MKKIIFAFLFTILFFSLSVFAQIPVETLVKISRAEDELRFDKTLEDLIKNADAKIRTRAALAAGRIGNEAAIPALVNLLETDRDENVRAMAAFGIGEIESIKGADAIVKVLSNLKNNPNVRARSIEAAGKIAAANAKEEKSKELGKAILENLEFEHRKRSGPYKEVIEYGLTAVLRARPENAEKTLVEYTEAYTPEIRANALNALARLRAKNANEQARSLLQTDADAIVRANSARVLGAAEDKDAFDLLLNAAINDKDSRVRVSAIRAVGNLKDAKAADKLLERGEKLLADYKKAKTINTLAIPSEENELLVIVSTLGTLLKNTDNKQAVNFVSEFAEWNDYQSPEIGMAYGSISPKNFLQSGSRVKVDSVIASSYGKPSTTVDWKTVRFTVQGFAELADNENENIKSEAEKSVARYLDGKSLFGKDFNESSILPAIPDVLNAYAKFKPENFSAILRDQLRHRDIFIRANAASLLGEQPAAKENIEALKTAFAQSLKTDKAYNDAQLAILSALVKLDKPQSFESLRLALTAPDYLIRKHAANLIKQNDLTKDFSNIEKMVGTVKSYNAKTGTKQGQVLNTEADYRRAVSRKNGSVKAVLTTEKGKFTIDLLPEDAPLTVDNFIKLARSNYFNGVAVHRVVPNFVMQDGDPRGDGNGGPGYSIRCEINVIPYDRGAVGMALSGKDTGGSQWFVTHSPQPHLDGGYTVFGRVNEADMKIVDQIVRGDKILKVEIVESR